MSLRALTFSTSSLSTIEAPCSMKPASAARRARMKARNSGRSDAVDPCVRPAPIGAAGRTAAGDDVGVGAGNGDGARAGAVAFTSPSTFIRRVGTLPEVPADDADADDV